MGRALGHTVNVSFEVLTPDNALTRRFKGLVQHHGVFVCQSYYVTIIQGVSVLVLSPLFFSSLCSLIQFISHDTFVPSVPIVLKRGVTLYVLGLG